MAEGATGGVKIARLNKGDSKRTAMHADVMNEIIDRLNALLSMTVSPARAGKFTYADANVVLESKASGGCGDTDPPATGTFVCGSVDGVKQWLATDDCSGIDGGQA